MRFLLAFIGQVSFLVCAQEITRGRQNTWANANKACKLAGSEEFATCQPATCNASTIAEKITNLPSHGRSQYWINGYVLRTPRLVYSGCYTFQQNTQVGRNSTLNNNNSISTCSRQCDTGEILLHKSECICIETKFGLIQEANNKCNISCWRSSDTCGGAHEKKYYSHYYIYHVSNEEVIGYSCFALIKMETNKYTSCIKELQPICELYNTSSQRLSYTCDNKPMSWYDSQKYCTDKGSILYSSYKNVACMKENTYYWSGTHVKEEIVWDNENFPENARCLTLVIDNHEYNLESSNCSFQHYSLCLSTPVSSTSTSESAKFETSSNLEGETALITEASKLETGDNTTVAIIAGTSTGVLLIVLIVVCLIVLILKRNRCKKPKRNDQSKVKTQSLYYSEAHVNEETATETKGLVQSTEEGVYNHLGDSEIVQLSPTTAVYDVMGREENEYDVSESSKRTVADNNIYDKNINDNTDMYNSANNTGIISRTEVVSDAYTYVSKN